MSTITSNASILIITSNFDIFSKLGNNTNVRISISFQGQEMLKASKGVGVGRVYSRKV